jgi:serine/threonine protein kinase
MPADHARVVGGRYALVRPIAKGGMAEVHEGFDTLLEREVAVKLMRDAAGDDASRERFRQEARILAGLTHHPGIVCVLDAGFDEEHPFLVMDLVRGTTFAQAREHGPIAPALAVRLGREVADALAYVHENGVIHRDVKPANIVIDAVTGRIRLLDFGIATLRQQGSGHTSAGQLIGTAAYLAPEQVREQRATAESDIYALGLVLLELLHGERIYDGSPIEAAMARLVEAPPIPDTLPDGMVRLLRRMTAMHPRNRPKALQVVAALSDPDVCEDPALAS